MHTTDCTCENCRIGRFVQYVDMRRQINMAMSEFRNQEKMIVKTLEDLGLHIRDNAGVATTLTKYISVMDLYDVLMDDEKFQALSSRLKNKAFW